MPNYKALHSGYSWNSKPSLNDQRTPVILTYSFPTSGFSWTGWAAFDAADKAVARAALKQWGDASGISFIEVRGDNAELKFQWEKTSETITAYAEFPEMYSSYSDKDYLYRSFSNGNVYLNTLARDELTQDRNFKSLVLLHEIGHALGLKHPFHKMDYNDQLLSSELDNITNTVMSYTGRENLYSAPQLGWLDIEAIQALYGAPSKDGTHLAAWSWQASKQILTQIGKSDSDKIFGTAVKDVIRGQKGNDRLYGFDGNDVLHGGLGKDTLTGGYGNDDFVFSTALNARKNIDKIVDFQFGLDSSGLDRIVLSSKVFKALPKGWLSEAAFTKNTHASDADHRIVYDDDRRIVFYDPDGSGPLAQIAFAKFGINSDAPFWDSFYIV
ncbi:matrixin family metalloprotease [Microvirga sp. 2MCAF38]|uniref:matrixin family metalloprotease n=1 Tax=Microvirga sp. 2MCAF38 TaxID=3232989 RepID=UPI003F9D1965